MIVDVGAYVPIPIVMDKLFVFLGPTVSLADDRYMSIYFGVTPAQSKASRLPVYKATGGIKNAGGAATVVDLIGDHWLSNFDGGYERLLRAALRSPVTLARTQVTANLNIGYRF